MTAPPLVQGLRPRQWLKNLLVLAAPIMAGQILERTVLIATVIAFVAFCAAASAIYALNDVLDVAADRENPRTRQRPVAAGTLSARTALIAAAALAALALGLAAIAGPSLVAVVATYLALSTAYCLWLKREPVLDIAIIASGFLLRAIAGGVAGGIELSQWFLLAASFGSLFMAAGKRYADVVSAASSAPAGASAGSPAGGRAAYTATYLRFVWTLSAAVLITTYGLWAFEVGAQHRPLPTALSLAPFVLAVLRYALAIDAGRGGEPEEIAWADRVLQSLALVWIVLVALAVY
ncbi:MAG: decaprenyl-phosphate phosphoribosyltransferase [Nocardioides sp.]